VQKNPEYFKEEKEEIYFYLKLKKKERKEINK
jgi:hypothetical protein